MELFIEQDEYVAELTENAGVRVTIHDQEKMPFPEDDGLLISADHMTMLGLTLVRFLLLLIHVFFVINQYAQSMFLKLLIVKSYFYKLLLIGLIRI